MKILDRALDAARHHHRPRFATNLAQVYYLLMEMIHHNFGFEPDRVVMALDKVPKLLLGPLRIEFRIALDHLYELVVTINRSICLQDIKDESLVDCLLHGVGVEGTVLCFVTVPEIKSKISWSHEWGPVHITIREMPNMQIQTMAFIRECMMDFRR
jgi:hypothetical protein